jgi:site-specific DNA-methyltransferase (adenine-specific)
MILYQSDRATVVQAEALAWLAQQPAGSVDAVVTDPPYSSGGLYRGDRAADPLAKYVTSNSAQGQALGTFAGDNRDQRSYLLWCALWLGEALRVCAAGGALVVFTDWRQLPVMTDAVQAGGWTWRGIVVWHKPVNRPQSGRFSSACEYAVWATAGHRPVDYPADTLQGLVTASAPQERSHPTQKPELVLRHLVRIAPPGGLVLDPFAGSGTTVVAALREGRRAVAVEVISHYATMCADRVSAAERSVTAAPTPDLFGQEAS